MSVTDVEKTTAVEPVLEVSDLTVKFGGNLAVDNFKVSVRPRERIALIGPNGAGKSTCVNAITGYVKCTGSINLGGHSVRTMAPFKRSRAGLVRTFQNLELFATMSVEENIAFGAALDSSATGSRSDRIDQTLEILHLTHMRDRQIATLAYGTRKLVELGRALVSNPRVLLLDEPMAGLDTGEKSEFVNVLQGLFKNSDSGILLIEHDMFAVEQLTEHVLVLDAGKLIATGSFDEVTKQQIVIDAYLGA